MLVDHDNNLDIEQKLRVNFKEVPSENFRENFMTKINISTELKKLIHSQAVQEALKKILKILNHILFQYLELDFRVKKEFFMDGTRM